MSLVPVHHISVVDEAALFTFAATLMTSMQKQQAGVIVYLSGPLGAGKTTFVRGLMRALGYHDKVKSPTYSLVEHYTLPRATLWHVDLYRLKDPKELPYLGSEDWFTQDAITLIEWPEQGGDQLPMPDLTCYINFASSGRDLRLVAHTPKGEAILHRL